MRNNKDVIDRMTIIDTINDAEESFRKVGIESPRLDAEILIAHALRCERVDLYIHRDRVIDEGDSNLISEFIDRRGRHEPVAYITGIKEFWSMPIIVSPDVLVPRPETELIVETTLNKLVNRKNPLRILDLCTGSGCIVVALAKELPSANFIATDLSNSALAIAKENLSFAADRTTFLHGDLFSALTPRATDQRFDIITANPPYVSKEDMEKLSPDILDFEPRSALVAEKYGLDFIERIIEDAPDRLNSGGFLIIEFGIGQASDIRSMIEKNSSYSGVEILNDLAGIERIACSGIK